jgi:hypothetical protein
MLIMHTVKSRNDCANIPDHHLRHNNRAPHPNHHGATSPSQVLPHWCDAVLWHWPTTSMSRSSRYLVSPWPECWASPSSCLHLSSLSLCLSLSLCNKLKQTPLLHDCSKKTLCAEAPNHNSQLQKAIATTTIYRKLRVSNFRTRDVLGPLLANDDESP